MLTKSVAKYKEHLTAQVENLPAVSYFNVHKNIKCVELRPRLWNHIVKDWLRIRSALRSWKSNCLVSNTFGQPLSALSTIRSLLSVQTVTRGDEVVIRDWLDNFRPVWQRTIRSESTHDKAGSLPPASWDNVMLFAIFLKRLKRFLHPLNSKTIV